MTIKKKGASTMKKAKAARKVKAQRHRRSQRLPAPRNPLL
jgi:hypothetical protein